MDAGVIVVSLVVGLFGVASTVLGFIAEATKLTPNDIDAVYGDTCDYPPNAAFVLSLIAAPLLAVAQIIVTVASGCCGCCRPLHGASETKRVVGIVSAVLSWIAALLAMGFYLNGAVWNAPISGRNETWCRIVTDGYFRRTALLSLAATVLGILSYIMLRAKAPSASASSWAPASAARGSEPGPDVPQQPPAGEAVAVPQQQQVYAHGQDRKQETFPDVPRQSVGGYRWASNGQSSRSPQRQAQPAYEVMMA